MSGVVSTRKKAWLTLGGNLNTGVFRFMHLWWADKLWEQHWRGGDKVLPESVHRPQNCLDSNTVNNTGSKSHFYCSMNLGSPGKAKLYHGSPNATLCSVVTSVNSGWTKQANQK